MIIFNFRGKRKVRPTHSIRHRCVLVETEHLVLGQLIGGRDSGLWGSATTPSGMNIVSVGPVASGASRAAKGEHRFTAT
jgi:hypothetical protein